MVNAAGHAVVEGVEFSHFLGEARDFAIGLACLFTKGEQGFGGAFDDGEGTDEEVVAFEDGAVSGGVKPACGEFDHVFDGEIFAGHDDVLLLGVEKRQENKRLLSLV